jgi:hypothetical protein
MLENRTGKNFQSTMYLGALLCLISTTSALELDRFLSEKDLVNHLERTPVESLLKEDIEAVVNHLYFDAAGLIIRKAHDADKDVSLPIRNAVSELRSKLDNLVKQLDPEFFKPQRVPPAFQWTQNDTTIFIQLKYSRRFNAPGAVDVDNLNCSFTSRSIEFSAIGGHSGKRFEYALNLDFFDEIIPEQSSWNIGSVGKVLLTIAKRYVSKWPRLLLTNVKIDNMHFWYDFGEKMEASLKPLPSITESTLTCASVGSLFCPTSGKCLKDCSECKSKPHAREAVCRGSPAYRPKEVNFTDAHHGFGSVGGPIEVILNKEYHRFDISGFNLYIVSEGGQFEESSKPISQILFSSNVTYRGELPLTEISYPLEIIAIPFNEEGENREKSVRKLITDLFKPENCSRIDPIVFEDTDASEGSIKGLFRFTSPANTNNATHLVFYWGKSETEKHMWASSITEISVTSQSYNMTSSTSIPPGVTHVLVFAKSKLGEGTNPVGVWSIDDRMRPKGTVADIRLLSDRSVEFRRVDNEAEITGYTVRCEYKTNKNRSQTEEVEVIPTAGLFTFSKIAKTSRSFNDPPSKDIKDGIWKVCIYLTNKMGSALNGSCVEIIDESLPTLPQEPVDSPEEKSDL